jgi:hypothetical protein
LSRGALLTLLLVVAAVLVPFALVGLWTHQVLLDRERFTNLADDLLDRSAVRRGLADQTVAQVERARPGLVAGEPALRAGVESVLTSPDYRPVFKQTLGDVHDQLTNDEDTLQLEVGPTVDFARTRLPGGRALPPGSQVPPVVIARRSEVPVLWGAIDGAQRISLVTPLIVLGLLALSVAMARRRWVMLGVVGSTVAGVSLLLLGVMALAKQVIGRRLDAAVSRDAFDATWDVIARSLTNSTLIIVLGALVVAAGGFVVHAILTRRPSPVRS